MSIKPPAFTTRSASNLRGGAWVYETKLTSEYVQKNGISHLADLKLDDARGTEGQPLIVPNVPMRDGMLHDVLYTADMSNCVYAFDVNTYQLLWKQRVGNPIKITKQYDMWGINPTWGIQSTPVIDAAKEIIYLLMLTSPDGTMANVEYVFLSLSLVDGSNVHPPLFLNDVTYQPPNGAAVKTLGSTPRKQRAALTLMNDTVFIPFGSFYETASSNNGWVVAVDVSASPTVAAAWTTGTNYVGAGIWMGGEGLSVDEHGYLFGLTGNGAFAPPDDFAECFFKLQYVPSTASKKGSLSCVDWWSPYTDAARDGKSPTDPFIKASMDEMLTPSNACNVCMTMEGMPVNANRSADQDLGSGGALIIPASLTGFGHNVIMGGGKDGLAYVLNSDNLGKTQLADFAPDRIMGNYAKLLSPPWGWTYYPDWVNLNPVNPADLPIAYGGYSRHIHGTGVTYISPDHGCMVFIQGENGPVRAARLNADYSLTYLGCGTEIASQGMKPPGGMPGGMLSLSCDGEKTNTGVLWSLMPWYGDANSTVTAGRLVAYGANWIDEKSGNLIKLWDSADYNWQFSHNKFNVCTVWGGKVFVPSFDGRIMVLG